jgi:hypothetical protein
LVSTIARKISSSSAKRFDSKMNVTLSSTGGGPTYPCNPLSSCFISHIGSGQFPGYPGNAPGSDVIVTATVPFQSPLTMFFPGLTNSTGGITITLHATSQEPIQF